MDVVYAIERTSKSTMQSLARVDNHADIIGSHIAMYGTEGLELIHLVDERRIKITRCATRTLGKVRSSGGHNICI